MLSVGCSGSGQLKGAEAQRCSAWRVAARRLASRPPRGVGPGPTRAVGWDPESVLAPPQEGHIARRQYSKKLQADASFLQQVSHTKATGARNSTLWLCAADSQTHTRSLLRYRLHLQEERRLKKVQAEVTAARLARVVPDGSSPAATVEFLLDTAADDMTFEVARCRPQLVRVVPPPFALCCRSETAESTPGRWHLQDEAFFAHLKEAIRLEKFNSRSRVERVAELEGLLAVVEVRFDPIFVVPMLSVHEIRQHPLCRMASRSWTRTRRC
jgi:hypothetical protein